jgi:hypothetical protein
MNFNMIKDFVITNYQNHEEKYLFLTKVFALYFLPHLFFCVLIVHLLSSVCVTDYECTFTISYKNNKFTFISTQPNSEDKSTITEADPELENDNFSVIYEESSGGYVSETDDKMKTE